MQVHRQRKLRMQNGLFRICKFLVIFMMEVHYKLEIPSMETSFPVIFNRDGFILQA